MDEAAKLSALCTQLHIPEQRPSPAMAWAVTTYPPLDRVTVVEHGRVRFCAQLDGVEGNVEVEIWYSADGAEWTALGLGEGHGESPVSLQKGMESKQRYFSGEMTVTSRCDFTAHVRRAGTWEWVRDMQGFGDGTVIVKSDSGWSDKLEDELKDLDSGWEVKTALSQSPRTSVWTLEQSIDAAGEESKSEHFSVGTPFGGFLRLEALASVGRC